MSSRPRRPWMVFSRSKLIVGLLLLILIVTSTLAYQAQDAARLHRQTAERALREYAAFAAWELTRRTEDQTYMALKGIFQPLTVRADDAALRDGVTLVHRNILANRQCRCLFSTSSYVFGYDFRSGRRVESGRAPEGIEALAAAAMDWASVPMGEWRVSLAFPPEFGGRGLAVASRRDSAGQPFAVFGFTVERSEITHLFETAIRVSPLLPTSLLRGAGYRQILSATVAARNRRLFASTPEYEPRFAAQDTFTSALGSSVVRVAINPEAASHLVIGGVPKSRFALLVTLVLLIAGLTLVAIHQLRREAELTRLRTDFVSGVSHELRTPLAQIRMFAETLLLGRVRTEAERQRSLQIIDQEARRLSQLVENVLRFSRTERRVEQVAPETTEISAEVAEIVEGYRLYAQSRKAEVRAEVQEGVMVSVDRGALRQIVLNLLENALKYGPAGQRVVVGLALFTDAARLWVDDEGPGIPASRREEVFAPFYRLARDSGSSVAGSGIGLAVVRQLAVLHRGRAWAEDAPGGGARIVVEIPGAYLRPVVEKGGIEAA